MRSPALSVALLVCAATAAGQTSGSQPGQIFEFGVSGRALGMGNAQTAITDDASALYYNPAGLGLLECRQAQALHAALYGGASFDSLDYGQNFDRNSGGWGLEVLRLALGGFEGYDASGSPTGSFGYSELGVGGGFAVNDVLLPDLSLGGALKLLDRSLRRGEITLRNIRMDKKNFDSEVSMLLDIINDAWSDNWGFVHMTRAEIDDLSGILKLLLRPGDVAIAGSRPPPPPSHACSGGCQFRS